MNTPIAARARFWLKAQNSPLSRVLYRTAKELVAFQLPRIPLVFAGLYRLHQLVMSVWAYSLRFFYWTPLFRSQVSGPSHRLYLYGGMPLITGGIRLRVGNNCRISGQTTFTGADINAQLWVGNNVDIGWQNTIAVGTKVVLQDNVRLAGDCFLAGYPGHPLDATRRALGEPCDPSQRGDIVLERNVWLATGVKVMGGVTIGAGTVVAAGSVVSQSLPAGVLAGGVPAKVIRKLMESHQ